MRLDWRWRRIGRSKELLEYHVLPGHNNSYIGVII